MRTRVNDLYKQVCIPKPTNQFILVDQEAGETVETKAVEVPRITSESDIIVYFVT